MILKNFVFCVVMMGTVLMIHSFAYADLNNGLVAYYPFNGNANDESGNGNTGTVYGATLTTDRFENFNSAYNFDGVNDYIDIGNDIKPPFPVTVSVWIKYDSTNGASIFSNDQVNGSGHRYGLHIQILNTGQLRANYFEGFATSSNSQFYASNNNLTYANEWIHIVAKFNAHKNVQFYVNGIEVTGYWSGSGSGMTYSNANGVIGMSQTRGGYYFSGKIDDIRVYDRALSYQEIQDLYAENDLDDDGDGYSENKGDCDDNDSDKNPGEIELCDGIDNDCDGIVDEGCSTVPSEGLVAYWPFNGNANDESGNTNHGTTHGAVLTANRFGNPNSAYLFAGNDYIDIPYNAGIESSVFTISLWVNTTQTWESDTVFDRAALINSDPDGYYCLHGYNISVTDESVDFSVDQSSACGNGNHAYGKKVNDGEWHHILAVYNSAPYLYVDGIYNDRGAVNNYPKTHAPINIGRQRNSRSPNCYLSGVLDDIRIYNRALSEQEIQALFYEDVIIGPVPEAPSSLSASDGTYTGKILLSWNASTDASSYDIYRAGIKIATTASTTYEDSPPRCNTQFAYWVKAKNLSGISGPSNFDRGFCQVAIPPAPTNVRASDGTYTGKVRIAWNAASGATSYEVYRAGVKIVTTSATSYDHIPPRCTTHYAYWVKAKNTYGVSKPSTVDKGYCASSTCTDKDNDGFYGQGGCGTAVDCNDSNSKIHPGADEINGDGIDQDCDGVDGEEDDEYNATERCILDCWEKNNCNGEDECEDRCIWKCM